MIENRQVPVGRDANGRPATKNQCFRMFDGEARTSHEFHCEMTKRDAPRKTSQGAIEGLCLHSRNLLHRDERAKWQLGEESARGVAGKTDTAVRCRIVRHEPFMHSEIEAVQAHEVRHLDLVDRGDVITILVSDDVIAGASRVPPSAAGRANRVEDRDAIFDERDFLRGKRDLDPQLFR